MQLAQLGIKCLPVVGELHQGGGGYPRAARFSECEQVTEPTCSPAAANARRACLSVKFQWLILCFCQLGRPLHNCDR